MSSWIWILIPMAAIVGAYIIDYQKNKLKWQAKSSRSEEELEELRKTVRHLKKRIENLEAIAADDDLHSSGPAGIIELDDREQLRKENEQTVAKKAKTKGET